jgi:CubicO group peptidase (beta-lactamase class C family)
MAYEYSNFGFALVGRVVSNTSRSSYSRYITESFLRPLGMQHTVWDIAAVPATQRAIGYRWENKRGSKSLRSVRARSAPWAD